MKTINPFKRLNKEDFIPCSLFPASKVCDTSMDIGRATPLYCLDMVAGNRVSLDVSQLTRFQPMLAPVMTNYSVEFGAFFVPYVAFDEFFQSTWFRTNCQNTDVQRKSVLRAREFFNPAIDNSEKVHPWMFSTKRCGNNVNWVGSLYDHLRAPLGLPDWSEDFVYTTIGTSIDDSEVVNAWLASSLVFGSGYEQGCTVADIFSNTIYGYGTALRLKDSSKDVLSPMQLFLANKSIFPSDVQSKIDSFLATSVYLSGSSVSVKVSTLLSEPLDLGVYYSNPKSITRANTVPHLLQTAGLGAVTNENSSSSVPFWMNWNPFSTLSSDYVDAFVKLIYMAWTGNEAYGTFAIGSDGLITYSYSESEQTWKKTSLSSLLEVSTYSQMLPLADSGSNVALPYLSLYSSGTPELLSFPLWIAKQYHLLDSNETYNKIVSAEHPILELAYFFTLWNQKVVYIPSTDDKVFARVMASLLFYFYGVTPSSLTIAQAGEVYPYSDLLGKSTIVSVQGAYRSYVESAWISANRNLEWNSVYWLAYQRIYADWFLNEHYTKHEDYLDMIGSAYIAGAQSLANGDGKTMDDWFSAGELADGNNPKISADSSLSYFGDRVAKGECMPVLWSLDCVTNLRQTTSTSSTPIGQSITENFYNRFYARFKDLINRMGPDYRRNARALYGKGPDDASLLRSQVVGYRSFDVQIGDVAQNSESSENSTLGQFAGYAVSRDKAGSFDWTAQESGVFVVLAWVRPKYTCFADLVPRSLYKKEYMDYLIPQFGGVGYQDFAYKQLNPTDNNPDSRLGFEERYSEYMMMDNECSGLMRTSMAYYNSNRIGTPCYAPGTADYYHLLYMDEESDLKRVFVDNYNDPILISAYFNGNVTRQLPATIKTEF